MASKYIFQPQFCRIGAFELQLHFNHDSKVAAARSAKRPKEYIFLGVTIATVLNSDLFSIRDNNCNLLESIATHAETSRKRANATSQNEAAHAHSGTSPTVNNMMVKFLISKFLLCI